MKYLVKDTPIRKNGKTYGVGKEFPYSDKDSKLLWNLEKVEETKQKPKNNSTEKKVVAKKTTKKGQSK